MRENGLRVWSLDWTVAGSFQAMMSVVLARCLMLRPSMRYSCLSNVTAHEVDIERQIYLATST